jgi:hypothetical protein
MKKKLIQIWKGAKKKIIDFLSRDIEASRGDTFDAENLRQIKNRLGNPGLECPNCKQLIKISIQSLLSGLPIPCPHCGLELSVDKNKSKETLEILSEVQIAIDKIEQAKQYRI